MTTETEFLTAHDVAKHLGLGIKRVYQLISAGRIPHVRLGLTNKTVRIPRAAWQEWVEQQNEKARAKETEKGNA